MLTLDAVSLLPAGATLTLAVHPGDSFAVMGRSSSGKSDFTLCAIGRQRFKRGKASLESAVVAAGLEGASKRTTPLLLAKRLAGRDSAEQMTEALSVCGLWDQRREPLSSLSPALRAAAELLPCVLARQALVVIDGQLDGLDRWALASVLEALRDRTAEGCALWAVSNRESVAEALHSLIILRQREVRYAGTLSELLSRTGPAEILVETSDRSAAAAVSDPFSLSVSEHESGLVVKAPSGQAAAARLLLEGYGSVRALVLKQPRLGDALDSFG